jgi:quercetin dioxygenase-like cupin family protein
MQQALIHDEQPREPWRAGVETRMQVSAANGSTQLCMFEQWVAPALGAPLHRHPVEEVLTVIAGDAVVWVDGQTVALSGGQSVVVPPGQEHGFRNAGSSTLHVRAVLASPVFEATYEGSATPVRRWLVTPTK